MSTLGERIKELREINNISQHELGEKLFVSDKAVSKWETNKNEPDITALTKMAELFHVTIDYLMTGKNKEAVVTTISKIELACREDNIALLNGVDLNEFDSNGKDVNYYANYYDAKNILKYLNDSEFEEYVNSGKLEKKKREFVVCAIPKDLDGDENLVLLKTCYKDEVSKFSSDLESRGYHSFKIFYRKEFYDKCSRDYQYMDLNVLGDNGKHVMCIQIIMLDDEKHGTIGITFYRDDGAKKETNALIHEKDFDEFLKVLEQVDFKNWENKYWGLPVYEIYFATKKEELDRNVVMHNKFYVAPEKTKYLAFVKALQKLAISSLKDGPCKLFFEMFNAKYNPHYHKGLTIEQSEKVFETIEWQKKFMETDPGHPY